MRAAGQQRLGIGDTDSGDVAGPITNRHRTGRLGSVSEGGGETQAMPLYLFMR
jgi:hypothetical protein